MTINRNLSGWKRQTFDERDLSVYDSMKLARAGALPPTADLRPKCSPIDDQGSIGSCTANMLAGMVELLEVKPATAKVPTFDVASTSAPKAAPTVTITGITQNTDGSVSFGLKVAPAVAPAPTPPAPTVVYKDISRLFHYYATRLLEGTPTSDSGASIRNTLKAANKYGLLDEKLYPYDVSKIYQNPSAALWTEANNHKVVSYHSVANGDITTMKTLITNGYAVGFGFDVYSFFMSAEMAQGGYTLFPPKVGETYQGGHAVSLVGYNDDYGAFLCRNSWGKGWGWGGYFWMSYTYVQNTSLCSDFWVVDGLPTL